MCLIDFYSQLQVVLGSPTYFYDDPRNLDLVGQPFPWYSEDHTSQTGPIYEPYEDFYEPFEDYENEVVEEPQSKIKTKGHRFLGGLFKTGMDLFSSILGGIFGGGGMG